MDDNMQKEKWTLEDGRRAERRVVENALNGETERVIELHVEDERPLRLQQRVVEKSKPIVYERKVETVDPATGNVIESKVESIEPKVQMQLVEHVKSLSNDVPVTRQEMIDSIVAAMKAGRESSPDVSIQSIPVPKFSDRLQTLGLADEISERVQECGLSTTDKILLVVIAVMVGFLGYMVYFM